MKKPEVDRLLDKTVVNISSPGIDTNRSELFDKDKMDAIAEHAKQFTSDGYAHTRKILGIDPAHINEDGSESSLKEKTGMAMIQIEGGIPIGEPVVFAALSNNGKTAVQTMAVSRGKFESFLNDFHDGVFDGQTLGKAFCDQFGLDAAGISTNLAEKDGDDALYHIHHFVKLV